MNTKILTLGMLVALSAALPGASAHWVDGAGAAGVTTHEHAVITGSGYTAGYFAQRICADNTAPVPVLYFSDGEGNCPLVTATGPTHPLVPPIRGFSGDLSLTGCLDLTLPTGDLGALDPFASNYKTGLVPGTPGNVGYFKNNPHVLSPSTTWTVDSGDVGDSFLSGTSLLGAPASTATMPVHAGSAHGNGGQTAQGVANRVPADAALRYIAGDGIPAGAGGVAARQDIRGQDIFGGDPNNRIDSSFGNRGFGSHAAPGQDNFDNDWETGEGDFCFTYAIDNAPDARGSSDPTVTQANLLTNTPAGSYDGCQVGAPGHLLSPGAPAGPATAFPGGHIAPLGGGCLPGGDGVAVFCGAGADWNDPVESGTTASLSLSLGVPPVGTILNREWVPHPIGNDGVFDSNTNCGGGLANPLSAHTNGAGVSNTVGKYGNGGAAAMPAANFKKGILLAQYLAGAVPIPTAVPANGAILDFPISYSVCNNVGEDGCTNIPIEGTMSAPAASNWQGHVTASMQQCVYDDTLGLATGNTVTNPGTGHVFQGQAMVWGSPTYAPSGNTCWPERLAWNSQLNVWVPHSQSSFVGAGAGLDADNPTIGALGAGAPAPGTWQPDWAPATGRDIEYIQGDIQLVQLTPFAGATICPPFTPLAAFPGCVNPTLPTGGWTVLGVPLAGLAGGWIDGYAAVFT